MAVLSMIEAIKEMRKKITAGDSDIKQQQIDLAMRIETKKQGVILGDGDLIALANTIRLAAEINLHGAGAMKEKDKFAADEHDLIRYLEK